VFVSEKKFEIKKEWQPMAKNILAKPKLMPECKSKISLNFSTVSFALRSLLFSNYHNCFVFIVDELNLVEPGNTSLDRKIAQLDQIFDECKLTFLLSKAKID
jgi:hypothetical protein